MLNNINTTSVMYEGNIECSLKIRGKIYKLDTCNSGTTYLKYIFAKAMYNYAELLTYETPQFIEIYKVLESGEEEAFTVDPIQISKKELTETVNGIATAATLTSYIRYKNITEEVDASSSNKYIVYLLTGEHPNSTILRRKLASFYIKPSVLAYITPGVTATLKWNMRLVNINSLYLKLSFAKAMCEPTEFRKYDTPGYISIYAISKFPEKYISLSGKLLVDEVGGFPTAVTYSAYIKYDDIKDVLDTQSDLEYYINISTHMDEIGQRYELTNFVVSYKALEYITPGTTAILNWTLRLINKDEGEL